MPGISSIHPQTPFLQSSPRKTEKFDLKTYQALEQAFLASKQMVIWNDLLHLFKSDLVLVSASPHYAPTTALSISKGLLHLLKHMASNGELSLPRLSSYIAPIDECDALINAEKHLAHIDDQACYEELKPHQDLLLSQLTLQDRHNLCNRFEQALRHYLLDSAFGKSSVDSMHDTSIDDSVQGWLEEWKEALTLNANKLTIGRLRNHNPEASEQQYQLGHVPLAKKREIALASLDLAIDENMMRVYAQHAQNAAQKVAAIREGQIDRLMEEILEVVRK